jgi:hypothetical protein
MRARRGKLAYWDPPTVEGPMNVGRMDGPSYIFAFPSQPHDFEFHLGVIFFCSDINMGIPLSQTVSTAGLNLPFVRKQL